MSVFYIFLPVALVVVGAGVAAYVWAARSGQFDDTSTPPVRAVIEDDDAPPARRQGETPPAGRGAGPPGGPRGGDAKG